MNYTYKKNSWQVNILHTSTPVSDTTTSDKKFISGLHRWVSGVLYVAALTRQVLTYHWYAIFFLTTLDRHSDGLHIHGKLTGPLMGLRVPPLTYNKAVGDLHN